MRRAWELFREQGADVGAGRVATELGFDHAVFRLELAVANGWFQHAHRLLDELEPGPERVWLGLREAEVAYHTAGDMPTRDSWPPVRTNWRRISRCWMRR